MQKQFLWAVVIVIILGGAFLLWQASTPSGVPSPDPTPTPTSPTPSPAGAPSSGTVTYTADGFSPSEVTIKRGGTVSWANQSGGDMWVASGPHPAHTGYNGSNLQQHCATGATPSFDQCAAGNLYTFTFDKVGTWPYHDHLHSTKFGRVIVVE